jgi:hypothetical protein
MLSAIIAALEARKKIRKSRLANDANARGRDAAGTVLDVFNGDGCPNGCHEWAILTAPPRKEIDWGSVKPSTDQSGRTVPVDDA